MHLDVWERVVESQIVTYKVLSARYWENTRVCETDTVEGKSYVD